MKKITWLFIGVLTMAHAQTNAPAVPVNVPPAPQAQPAIAQTVLVQPSRIEARIAPGNTALNIGVTLFSRVATEVFITSGDDRLIVGAGDNGKVRLGANVLQNVNCVVLVPHRGVITVTNSDGSVLAKIPYQVEPPKDFNQSAGVNYNPFGKTAGISYSFGNVPTSPLAPSWTVSLGIGADWHIDYSTTSNISASIRW